MILAAGDADVLALSALDRDVPPGSKSASLRRSPTVRDALDSPKGRGGAIGQRQDGCNQLFGVDRFGQVQIEP